MTKQKSEKGCKNSNEKNRYASKTLTTDICGYRNISIELSRDKFIQEASKSRTCNIEVSSKNFKQLNGQMVASIEISRSHFQENKVVIVPVETLTQGNSDDQTNRFEFRNRKRKQVNSFCPPAKRSRALVVPNAIKPKLIVAKKETLSVGQIVLAKMKSYSEWPARIQSLGKTVVNVYFFGDETTGNVPFGNIGMLIENHQLMRANLQKKIHGYAKAVRSVESMIKLPDHLSVFNES